MVLATQAQTTLKAGNLLAWVLEQVELDVLLTRIRSSTHQEHAHISDGGSPRADYHDVSGDIDQHRPDKQDRPLASLHGNVRVGERCDEPENVHGSRDEQCHGTIVSKGLDDAWEEVRPGLPKVNVSNVSRLSGPGWTEIGTYLSSKKADLR